MDTSIGTRRFRARRIDDWERRLWTICGSGMCGLAIVAVGMVAGRLA